MTSETTPGAPDSVATLLNRVPLRDHTYERRMTELADILRRELARP